MRDQVIRFPTDTEIRYCNSKVDKTSFLTGDRTMLTLDIMMLREPSWDVPNPYFITTHITVITMLIDGVRRLCESVCVTLTDGYDDNDNLIIKETFFVTADMVDNPIWGDADELAFGPLCDACMSAYNEKYGDGTLTPPTLDENGEGVCFENGAWKAVLNIPDVAEPK